MKKKKDSFVQSSAALERLYQGQMKHFVNLNYQLQRTKNTEIKAKPCGCEKLLLQQFLLKSSSDRTEPFFHLQV